MGMWLRQLNATQEHSVLPLPLPSASVNEERVRPSTLAEGHQPCLPHFLGVQTETPWAFYIEMQSS